LTPFTASLKERCDEYDVAKEEVIASSHDALLKAQTEVVAEMSLQVCIVVIGGLSTSALCMHDI
jgi:hypothetical protein